ncbi:Gfo/Idh/MocA family oxidoreductase [Gammaproteobacteria bacterium]|nr:Gfo/Idh/MocA family oxidoreductase [Gammaproteobacteria bacterium]MDA9113808.1 Gfo/Idh/MocA family oxidoreductase [Gammaproteobacteria bacterium]
MRNVAVIGLGNIAKRHRANLKLIFPNSTIYAMSASGRSIFTEVDDVDKFVTSIEELLDAQIEFAVIASPAPFHAESAIKLIENGIPILIEKPVTTNIIDAHKIQAAQDKYKTSVGIGYCLRFLPSALVMKERIDSGIIGKPYYCNIEIGQFLPDWRPDINHLKSVSAQPELGGGVLLELSHELDYAAWFLGDLKLEHAVLSSSEELGLKVEDTADIMCTTSKNVVANIHLDFLQKNVNRKCRIVGTEGALEWDLIQNEVRHISNDNNVSLYCEPKWDKNKMYINMMIDFLKDTGPLQSNVASLTDATKTVTLIENIKSRVQIRNI